MRVLLRGPAHRGGSGGGGGGPGARAGQLAFRHARYRQALVRLRRHHGRAAAQTLPPGSKSTSSRRAGGRRQPAVVAKNETPLGLSFTVTNRWAFEGKEAYHEKLGTSALSWAASTPTTSSRWPPEARDQLGPRDP